MLLEYDICFTAAFAFLRALLKTYPGLFQDLLYLSPEQLKVMLQSLPEMFKTYFTASTLALPGSLASAQHSREAITRYCSLWII